MSRTIWLASYPKSGNTWFRMLLTNLYGDSPADINDLPDHGGIASARTSFDHLSLIDSGLLTHDECDRLRPLLYEEMAKGAYDDEHDASQERARLRFVKVHDAYTFTVTGTALLAGCKGAQGAIVIVRDPRDIAPSLANHNHINIDEAIANMNESQYSFSGRLDRQPAQLRQKLLTWSGHVQSWLDQTDIPVHLIRYEDMQANTENALASALAFANLPASATEIRRAVKHAAFGELTRQEKDRGFREAPRHGTMFFRRGLAGAWREDLSPDQVACIEEAHGSTMQRLGYQLTRAEAKTG